jgi:hypothetical protein
VSPKRAAVARSSQIDNTLYDAFGQRQVSVIYKAQNQHHVVMARHRLDAMAFRVGVSLRAGADNAGASRHRRRG